MVLNELKQIRDELSDSAKHYDNSFKQVALIAAEELVEREKKIEQERNMSASASLTSSLDKQYFLNKYGSLKEAKAAYTKMYGKRKYGRSWTEFITVARRLDALTSPTLALEARITKIEDFLISLGYQP